MAKSIIKHPVSDREELALLGEYNQTYSFGTFAGYDSMAGTTSAIVMIPTSIRLKNNYEASDYDINNEDTENLNQFFIDFNQVFQTNGVLFSARDFETEKDPQTDEDIIVKKPLHIGDNEEMKVRVRELIIKNTGMVIIRLYVYNNNNEQIKWDQVNNNVRIYTPYVGYTAIKLDIDAFLTFLEGKLASS